MGGSSRRKKPRTHAAPAPTRAPATASPMGTRVVFIIVDLIPNFWSIVERFVEPDPPSPSQTPRRVSQSRRCAALISAHQRPRIRSKKRTRSAQLWPGGVVGRPVDVNFCASISAMRTPASSRFGAGYAQSRWAPPRAAPSPDSKAPNPGALAQTPARREWKSKRKLADLPEKPGFSAVRILFSSGPQ